MLLSLLPYAANLIVLAVYFFLPRPHLLFDFSTVSAWPIVVFALFAVLNVLAFSLHETTRQLVRIYLLQKSGVGYDDSLLPVYQLKLTPNWTVPVIPIYMVSQVASFALLLFLFGWGAAVLAHVIAYAINIWIPIPYSLLMPSMKTHLARSSAVVKFAAFAEGFDTERFMSLIDKALSERRNLGDWWATLLHEKVADQDKINQAQYVTQLNGPESSEQHTARIRRLLQESALALKAGQQKPLRSLPGITFTRKVASEEVDHITEAITKDERMLQKQVGFTNRLRRAVAWFFEQ